jgi:hypothetical protein
MRVEMNMWTPQQRRRVRWIGAVLVVGGVALNLYASALAAFQMGGSCKQFGFKEPNWNCRQASIYVLCGVFLFVGGIITIGLSFLRPQR